jgi:alpha-beta hydrolase superfamily lysophospholipase
VPQFAEYAVLRLTVSWTISGLARALAVAGYAVFGMDYPGFGLSEGLHGYIPNFDILVDDVMEQYRIIKGEAHSHCFTLITLS